MGFSVSGGSSPEASVGANRDVLRPVGVVPDRVVGLGKTTCGSASNRGGDAERRTEDHTLFLCQLTAPQRQRAGVMGILHAIDRWALTIRGRPLVIGWRWRAAGTIRGWSLTIRRWTAGTAARGSWVGRLPIRQGLLLCWRQDRHYPVVGRPVQVLQRFADSGEIAALSRRVHGRLLRGPLIFDHSENLRFLAAGQI